MRAVDWVFLGGTVLALAGSFCSLHYALKARRRLDAVYRAREP